jgi:hypothetical protein
MKSPRDAAFLPDRTASPERLRVPAIQRDSFRDALRIFRAHHPEDDKALLAFAANWMEAHDLDHSNITVRALLSFAGPIPSIKDVPPAAEPSATKPRPQPPVANYRGDTTGRGRGRRRRSTSPAKPSQPVTTGKPGVSRRKRPDPPSAKPAQLELGERSVCASWSGVDIVVLWAPPRVGLIREIAVISDQELLKTVRADPNKNQRRIALAPPTSRTIELRGRLNGERTQLRVPIEGSRTLGDRRRA